MSNIKPRNTALPRKCRSMRSFQHSEWAFLPVTPGHFVGQKRRFERNYKGLLLIYKCTWFFRVKGLAEPSKVEKSLCTQTGSAPILNAPAFHKPRLSRTRGSAGQCRSKNQTTAHSELHQTPSASCCDQAQFQSRIHRIKLMKLCC